METQELVSRLSEWTGSLQPTPLAPSADLREARKRLSACLLGGQVDGVLPTEGNRRAASDHSPTRGLDEATLAELTEMVRESQAADAQTPVAAGREAPAAPNELGFRRQCPTLTSQSSRSVPAWADGWAVDRTLGPFLGHGGQPFWFDFRSTLPGTTIVRGPDGSLWLSIPTPRAIAGLPGQFELPAGSVWIASKLLADGVPAGSFTGLRIRGGTLTLSAPPVVVPGIINAPAGATLTMKLRPDPPPSPAPSSAAAGADGKAISVVFPAEVVVKLPTIAGRAIIAAENARLTAYGSTIALAYNAAGRATFEPVLNRILVPFDGDARQFRVVAASSRLFAPAGSAPLTGAAALPVAVSLGGGGPGTFGPAEGAGALVLAVATGLTAGWPGLAGLSGGAAAVDFGPAFLLAEPGRLSVAAAQVRGRRQSQTLALWQESAGGSVTRSTIELTYDRPFTIGFDSDGTGNGADVLTFARVMAVAHLDRPMAADGRRIAFRSSAASLALSDANGQLNLELDAPADAPAAPLPAMALALTNALMTTSPPDDLALFGVVQQGVDVSSGDLLLGFGLLRLVPTLRDPYAASFSSALAEEMAGDLPDIRAAYGRVIAEVQWSQPAIPGLNLSLELAGQAAQVADRPAPADDAAGDVARRGLRTAAAPTAHPVANEDQWGELITRFYELSGGGVERFRLLDVSSRADQFGVGFGPRPADHGALPSAPQVQIQDLDLVTPGNNLRVFTLPSFQWEPVHNIPSPENPELGFPAELVSDIDGGPTQIGINTVTLVPLAPVPAVAEFLSEYNSSSDPKSGAALVTLPFGMVAVAELARGRLRPWMAAGLAPNSPKFPAASVDGGMQLSLVGALRGFPPRPQDESRGFPGATVQLLVGYDEQHPAPPDQSVLGAAIERPFNAEFGPGGAGPRVPVTRLDVSGYGASCFSDWRNPAAGAAAITQVRFDGFVGRTAYEVVQFQSLMYPWGVRVVRTITVQRTGGGGVFRRDSGWQAASDGTYDFVSGGVNPGIVTHPGVVRGVFNVRSIRDTTQLYEHDYPAGGANPAVTVKAAAVLFDADVQIEGAILGANGQGQVPARDMLGFVQLVPIGAPLTPAQLDDLMSDRGPVGGPIDCLIDVGGSGQQMRVVRVEVSRVADPNGNPELVAAARGPLVLPKAGQWSLTNQGAAEPESHELDPDSSIPLIRQSTAAGAPASPYRFADPSDLFRPDAPAADYGLLQSTDVQRMLMRRPKIEAGDRAITSMLPLLLADAYVLAGGVAMFPRPERCIPLPAGSRMQVTGPGKARLTIPPQVGQPANTFVAAAPERVLTDSGSLKMRVAYADENNQPTRVQVVIDSDATPDWSMSIGPISLINDIDSFANLTSVVGTFMGSSAAPPQLTTPRLLFGGVLQPVQAIINILKEIDLPIPFIVSMTNKTFTIRFQIHLAIPPWDPLDPYRQDAIETGSGKIRGKLDGDFKSGFGLTADTLGGLFSSATPAQFAFEIGGKIQVAIIPDLLYTGGALKFTIDAGAARGQPTQIQLIAGWVGSLGGDLVPEVLKVEASVTYGYVLQFQDGRIGLGVNAELEIQVDVLHGLTTLSLMGEATAVPSRLNGGDTVQIDFEISLGVEVTIGWFVNISMEVEWQLHPQVSMPLFAIASLLPIVA